MSSETCLEMSGVSYRNKLITQTSRPYQSHQVVKHFNAGGDGLLITSIQELLQNADHGGYQFTECFLQE